MTLHLGQQTLYLAFPVLDFETFDITWRYDAMPVLQDDSTGGNDVNDMLNTYTDLNARNRWWTLLGDPINARVFGITAGDNTISFSGAVTAEITLNRVDVNTDKWWFPSDYAEYGFIQVTNALGKTHQVYINSPTQFINFDFHPPVKGLRVHLFKTNAGTIKLYPWLGVPPLQFSFDASTWTAHQGGFPWFGSLNLPEPTPT
jgi:hypothetical protein